MTNVLEKIFETTQDFLAILTAEGRERVTRERAQAGESGQLFVTLNGCADAAEVISATVRVFPAETDLSEWSDDHLEAGEPGDGFPYHQVISQITVHMDGSAELF